MTAGVGRRTARAVLLALGIALLVQVATADGPGSITGRLGGDYVAFHAAGEVGRDVIGQPAERLYDVDAQHDAQRPLLPEGAGRLYFAYPPFAVIPYLALSLLPFGVAYLVHTVLMAGAVFAAVRTLRPVSDVVARHQMEATAAALTFLPLFRGVTGGQNTAISLLLVALLWRCLDEGRQVPAGVAAGLLLFKPPLALPFLGALVLARRWRAVGSAAATAATLALVAALLTGWSWPAAWVDAVRFLDRYDTPANLSSFVSFPGAAEAWLGLGRPAALLVGYGVAGLVAVVVAWSWLRERGDVGARVALTGAGAVAVSPHALYYDAGLLLLVAVVVLDRRPALRPYVAVAWLAGASHLLSDRLGWSPVVLLVAVAVAAAGWITWASPQPGAPVAGSGTGQPERS